MALRRAQLLSGKTPEDTEEGKVIMKGAVDLRKCFEKTAIRRTGYSKNPDGTSALGLAEPIEHFILKPLYPEDQEYVNSLATEEAKRVGRSGTGVSEVCTPVPYKLN
jgi:hypothetical protein